MEVSAVIAQLGARMHYAVPRIFHNKGMLNHLYTDIHASLSGIRWMQGVPKKWRPQALNRLLGRKIEGIPEKKISSFPLLGLRYSQRLSMAGSKPERVEAHLWAGKQFNRHVIRAVEGQLKSLNMVYTFNTAGLELLQVIKGFKATGIVEQTIAPSVYERQLLREEASRYPEWEDIEIEDDERLVAYAQREKAEWEAADMILCGSKFVKDSIQACGGPSERCVVVPYGVSLDMSKRTPRKSTHTPIRVLSVGTVGLRKGTPYMLKLADQLGGKAEIRMVGSIQVHDEVRSQLASVIDLVGRVPRSTIEKHYQWADVFVLPSICEGSATVCYEALSHGLPVICTPNTGSIVRDGVDGFVVPIRSSDELASKVELLAEDRMLYQSLSTSALERARTAGSMEAYAKRLMNAIKAYVPS